MGEIKLPEVEKFWTNDKYRWLRDYGEISFSDLDAIKKMVDEFNKAFGCNRSAEVVYQKYRTRHRLKPLKKFEGNKKMYKMRSGGIASFKLNRI